MLAGWLVVAATPASELAAAQDAFAAASYEAAAAGYQRLIEAGHDSGWLYYDLGNAELRQGRLGEAIASLRQARSRLPREADVAINLDFARGQCRDALAPPESPAVWQVLAFWHFGLSLRELAWAAVAAWAAMWSAWTLRVWRPGSATATSAAALLLAALCALGGSYAWRLAWPERVAVVRREDAAVHSGPGAQTVVRFKLQPGSEARVRDAHDGWLQVALSDGKEGWLAEADAVVAVLR